MLHAKARGHTRFGSVVFSSHEPPKRLLHRAVFGPIRVTATGAPAGSSSKNNTILLTGPGRTKTLYKMVKNDTDHPLSQAQTTNTSSGGLESAGSATATFLTNLINKLSCIPLLERKRNHVQSEKQYML
ncbi:hypothetical protein X801_02785 [Opisthorchis viverrini]|uniref:Uncharacterized protein n=1 Tax=Opisthorchis viverrini TaxID=6198 RepID=A0A1S8X3M1_OPIVI|nr:hypothetical protein X801_02785 [Opisthorchis viverrini]